MSLASMISPADGKGLGIKRLYFSDPKNRTTKGKLALSFGYTMLQEQYKSNHTVSTAM